VKWNCTGDHNICWLIVECEFSYHCTIHLDLTTPQWPYMVLNILDEPEFKSIPGLHSTWDRNLSTRFYELIMKSRTSHMWTRAYWFIHWTVIATLGISNTYIRTYPSTLLVVVYTAWKRSLSWFGESGAVKIILWFGSMSCDIFGILSNNLTPEHYM
jgi:hypothetical protein